MKKTTICLLSLLVSLNVSSKTLSVTNIRLFAQSLRIHCEKENYTVRPMSLGFLATITESFSNIYSIDNHELYKDYSNLRELQDLSININASKTIVEIGKIDILNPANIYIWGSVGEFVNDKSDIKEICDKNRERFPNDDGYVWLTVNLTPYDNVTGKVVKKRVKWCYLTPSIEYMEPLVWKGKFKNSYYLEVDGAQHYLSSRKSIKTFGNLKDCRKGQSEWVNDD